MLAYKLYSCDDHLDLNSVPPDLWTSRVTSARREDVPHVVERAGRRSWVAGGRIAGASGASNPTLTALSRAGLERDAYRPSNPAQRIDDMDRDEVHASIVYGPFSLSAPNVADPAIETLVLQAWNDWAGEVFNAYMPDRLNALAFLPCQTPEGATAELERIVAMGHRGAIVNPFEFELHDPAWDRLWATAAELEIPISFHIGGGTKTKLKARSWRMAAVAASLPLQLDEPLAVMIFSGALERNPGLKLVLAESGIGWLPYFIARMDTTFEKHCVPNPGYSIKMRPSELVSRQVWATFEEDALGPQLIPLLDPDRVMWASDFPHPDSTWPESRRAVRESLAGIEGAVVRKLTSDNCRLLYRIP